MSTFTSTKIKDTSQLPEHDNSKLSCRNKYHGTHIVFEANKGIHLEMNALTRDTQILCLVIKIQ